MPGTNRVLYSALIGVLLLFTCNLSWAQSCEDFYSYNPLDARVKMNRTELNSALVYAKNIKELDLAKTIYGFSVDKKPNLSDEASGIVDQASKYLESLGAARDKAGSFYLEGERVHLNLGFGGAGFAQINLKGAHRELGGNASRVYLSFHPEIIKRELPLIIQSATKAGAYAIKFFLGSEENLLRPDRFIVAFNHPIKAIEYAMSLQRRYSEEGITGERVPFTYLVGTNQNSPVSFGKDINPPFEFKSWRGRVSDTIAEALSQGNTSYESVRAYLFRKGIDPDFWLPRGLVKEIIKNR